MKKQDLVSIAITGAMGFFAGIFMFVSYSNSLPVVGVTGDQVPTQAESEAYSIIAETYGICEEACPSFQLLENGSYRYRYTEVRGEPAVIREGTLPLSLQSDVRRALEPEVLSAQSDIANRTVCASQSDAVDFRYEITLEGEEYVLDSCTTAIDDQSDVWRALTAAWNYFQTVE
jgi:hypothetical protein